jgi:hypothetical protein
LTIHQEIWISWRVEDHRQEQVAVVACRTAAQVVQDEDVRGGLGALDHLDVGVLAAEGRSLLCGAASV